MARRNGFRAASRSIALLGTLAVTVLCTDASRASAQIARGSQPITYHGGPVLSPHIACLMWSPNNTNGFSAADKTALERYLNGVQEFLSNQNTNLRGNNNGFGVEPAIRQYGVWGAQFNGSCVPDHHNLPRAPIPFDQAAGNTIVTKEITWAQQNLGLDGYDANTVVLVFTKGIAYDAKYGAGICAYHNYFNQTLPFGLIPYPSGGCLHSQPLQDFQVWTSHELFEAATDPLGTSWYATGDPLKDGGGEIGDDCPGVFATFEDGLVGVLSQVTDDVSGLCQTLAPEEVMGATAVKTGNTITLVAAHGTSGISINTSDGTSAWTQTADLIGNITEAPAVLSPDGVTIDFFGRGTDGELFRNFYDGSGWSGWQNLGGYWIGPPAAGYRTSAGKYIFVRGYDGNIYYYRDGNSNTFTFQGQLALGTTGTVRAVTPPQTFAVDNDCFNLFINGSDGHIWVDQICSDITLPVQMTASNGPQRVSSFSNSRGILDVVLNGPIIGGLELFPVSGLGGQIPYEVFIQNGVTSTITGIDASFVGPTSGVALSGQSGVWVGRAAGTPTSYPLVSTSGDLVHWSSFSALDGNVAMAGAPYIFSPDGVTADVFMGTANGTLQHKRFNGVSWQATQQTGITVQ